MVRSTYKKMIRSTYKKKYRGKRNNPTIKKWGGADGGVDLYKCPYCDTTAFNILGVYAHCELFHTDKLPPSRIDIRKVRLNIPVRSDNQRNMDDVRAARIAAAPAARPSGTVAARHRPSGTVAARPRPSGAVAAPTSRHSAAIAAAATYTEYNDLGEPPTEAFTDPITYDILIDPVVASDGFTYERSTINKIITGKKISPFTRKELTENLIPNNSIKSAINTWAATAKNRVR